MREPRTADPLASESFLVRLADALSEHSPAPWSLQGLPLEIPPKVEALEFDPGSGNYRVRVTNLGELPLRYINGEAAHMFESWAFDEWYRESRVCGTGLHYAQLAPGESAEFERTFDMENDKQRYVRSFTEVGTGRVSRVVLGTRPFPNEDPAARRPGYLAEFIVRPWWEPDASLSAGPRVLSRIYEAAACSVELYHAGEYPWTFQLWTKGRPMIFFERWDGQSWQRQAGLFCGGHPWEHWQAATNYKFQIDFAGKSPDTRAVLTVGEPVTNRSVDVVLAYHPDWIE